jgi:DNA replication protein DnaC
LDHLKRQAETPFRRESTPSAPRRFMTAANLPLAPATAHRQNNLKEVMRRAIKAYRVLVTGEIGYLPMNREQANRFVQVIAALYEKGRLSATSNLPFGQWDATFAQDTTLTAALPDRLPHHAQVVPIAGESHRLKHQRQAGMAQAISPRNESIPVPAGDGGVSVLNR